MYKDFFFKLMDNDCPCKCSKRVAGTGGLPKGTNIYSILDLELIVHAFVGAQAEYPCTTVLHT